MQKLSISVIIITLNEEQRIRDCLESVKWADEIILVDAFSSDATVDIARNYTNTIFQRQWPGYSEQRNFGLAQAKNEWVLFLDADERISAGLAEEIGHAISNSFHDAYYLLRQSFYLGEKIEFGEWNPDWKLRLAKKQKAKWIGPSVHEIIAVEGSLAYLENPMLHFGYTNLRHHFKKFHLYSSLFAKDAFESKAKIGPETILIAPLRRFVNGYFRKRGYKDGYRGLIIALMQSWEVFLRYVKLFALHIWAKA